MPNPSSSRRHHRPRRKLVPWAACLVVTIGALGAAGAAQAAPPPAAAAPVVVFTEDFENVSPPTTPVLLPAYTGPPPTNTMYTADPYYLNPNFCNGIITSFNSSANANCAASGPNFDNWNRTFARSLGRVTNPATETDNHALIDFTTAGTSPANGAVLQTLTSVPVPAGRFLAFDLQVSAAFCNQPAGHPLLAFYLLDGPTAIPSFNQPINPCTAPGSQQVTLDVPGVGPRSFQVGTYATDSAILFNGTNLGLRLDNQRVVNGLGGNDFAIDNIRVLDATPQLSKDFAPAAAESGTPVALTFTITNTTELAAKPGWAFVDTLPAGLTVADPAGASTTCTGGSVTAAAGSGTISATGNLNAGQASCTFIVNVTAGTGTYTNGPDNVTSTGLNPITPTAVAFAPVVGVSLISPQLAVAGATLALAAAGLVATRRRRNRLSGPSPIEG